MFRMKAYGHRRSIRLQTFHYGATAAYFITTCTTQRQFLFGTVAQGMFQANALGDIVAQEWHATGPLRNVVLDAFVVMPNHVHGIVVFDSETGPPPIARAGSRQPLRRHTVPLANLVSGFKASVTKRARLELGWDGPLWQRNYYEHVIRSEDDLTTIRNYIVYNPAKWAEDRYHM